MNYSEKTANYIARDNLYLLFRLRNIAIVAQSATLFVAVVYLQMALPILPLVSAIALLALINLYTRIRLSQSRPLVLAELVVQLCMDIIVLTILLSLSGGASNPFAILYLLPLTITAMLLPARVTWGISLLTVICYSLLLVVYVPMPHALHHDDAFNLHIVGMWLGFVLSAGVIAYFIVGLQKIISKQAYALHQAKQDAIKSEQLVKLGVLAASAAHDIGTPLNTISFLLEDLAYADENDRQEWREKILSMQEQVYRCKTALRNMSQSAGNISLRSGSQHALLDYLQSRLKEWRSQYSETEIQFNYDNAGLKIMADEVLDIALSNIIDNAIEASPERIEISVESENSFWAMMIRDFGPGISKEQKNKIGESGFTTKQHGLGLGVFLSHSIIERLGGVISLYNHPEGGLCTRVQIPAVFQQVST